MRVLENFEPKDVLKYFEEISMIPRGSGNTKTISDYCVRFAKDRGLFVTQDALGNVIIKKPATKGREQDAGVIIQGHLDMVAEKKTGSDHDFLKDGLKLYVEDGFIKAKDTTLGGDDGIAVAYGLAILDSNDISHPSLEVIFTIDEETGMDGARELDMTDIQGSYILNLDSEEEGIFVAGCAGGAKVKANISYRTIMTEGVKCTVRVEGLKGGHSGVEIDKKRGNADIIMARTLREICSHIYIECISITGGSKDNAIPRECTAEILVNEKNMAEVKKIVREMDNILKSELSSTDSNISVSVTENGFGTYTVIVPEDFKNILFYLNTIPNGIQHMSADIDGLVETSLNLGILTTEDNCMTAVSSVRSSVGSRKKRLIARLSDIAEIAGGFIEVRGEYPAWEYKKESGLRELVTETYRELFHKEPKTNVIHAGLECGYFSDKKPGIDIIAFGPDIFDIHTTEERMSIESVARGYELIKEILKKIH